MSLDLCARLGVGGMVLALIAVRVSANTPGTEVSRLWGERGELRVEGGRLPDFSYAGYRHGEAVIPDYTAVASVADFGARGDDELDDSEAFLQAIAATEAGAILVPPGRYVITKVLRITRPDVVLRGAGAERTTLFFPTPLDVIEPDTGATTEGRRTSNYSWSGGFVRLQGWLGSRVITRGTADARRGERRIEVEDTSGLRAGQVVEIFVRDTADNSLAKHLYSGDPGQTGKLLGRTTASLVTRVTAVEPGAVTLERELRFDVRAEWLPVVRAFEPTVRDSGVEDLTFEFPAEPYGGHFSELGYNPVAFVNVAHCWARRLRFVNPDSGPMVGGAFNTVSDVVYESQRAPAAGGVRGHHGIYMGRPGDHLFTRFDIRMRFIHDISVSQAAGVVVSEGRGEDLCFDHHKRAPFEVLFTNIDLGQGTRPWRSGGGVALGKHAGARVTFWNLSAETALPVPPAKFAPWSVNFVGVDFGEPAQTESDGVWRELPPGVRAWPLNLHEAQLDRRLKGRGDE